MKILLFLTTILGLSITYLQYNPSYKLSVEAKYYYTIGKYQKAYNLADESLKLREYNTMAFHIRNRSSLTLEVIDFNKESKDFQDKVIAILKKDAILRTDKLRTKMMSDVIISKYQNLSLSMVDDNEIKDLALQNFKKFQKINQKVIFSLNKDK